MPPKPTYAELENKIKKLEISEKKLRETAEQLRLAFDTSHEAIPHEIVRLRTVEKTLQESQKKFRQIYDNLLDVYYESNFDGVIIEVSPSIEKHSQYKREELIGSSLFKIFSNSNERKKLIELIFKNGGVRNYEISLNDKDGAQYNCLINSELIRDSMGRPIKFAGLFHNISERRLAEKALLESEAKFRLIFECAPLGILHFDNKGIITTCNSNFVSIIGSSAELLIGLNMHNLPDKGLVHTLKEALEGRATWFEGDYSSMTAEKITPVRLQFSPIFSKKGVVKGGIGIIEDVTDRKQAQKALMDSEKKYKHLFNNAPAGMCEIDLKKGKFINVNNVMCKYSGYTEEEFLQMSALNILTEESQTLFMKGFKKLISDYEISDNTEYNIIKKDGQTLCVVLNSHFIYKDGKLSKMIIVAHDITERKKMEEMIIQNEKMLSVGGLAAGMAHEINNPLAGMMQVADVIGTRLGDIKMPANLRVAEEIGIKIDDIKTFMEKRGILQMLTSINQSGIRMADIVENMLSFSRKSNALVKSHALSGLFDKTLELAATDFNLKKHYNFKVIEIKKEFYDNVPLIVCEGSKIQQVLLNILLNGAQAMQEAETVKPEFIVRIYLEENKQMVCVEINDNGPGMDRKTQKRIFEPFFTTKPVGIGTGLGLSVSYFIVTENHGGEMSVESRPGHGAKFIIRLPIEGKTYD